MINKKGMSVIVGSMILILLVIVTGLVVWNIVSNLIDEELGDVESCFGVFEQVTLNERYTCYDSTNDYVRISLSIGDVDVDGVVIQIEGAGNTRSFTLTNTAKTASEFGQILANYPNPNFVNDNLVLPGKNSGNTYVYLASEMFSGTPDIIKIMPVISEKQCEMSDSISQIDSCASLV